MMEKNSFVVSMKESLLVRLASVCLIVCVCFWSLCPFGSTVVCVCCYYIAAAIAVAATATIVATAASHAPPTPHVLCPSVHPVPLTHAKLEGEKSDPLQSKAQVFRQNMLLFPAKPIYNIFILLHRNLGESVV